MLFDNSFVHYGFPRQLHSDQGRNSESKTIQQLVEITPSVIAEENKGIADATSVSDVGSEVSFTITPRRAPVPAPRKTRPKTSFTGPLAETIPSPEKEHSVHKQLNRLSLKILPVI